MCSLQILLVKPLQFISSNDFHENIIAHVLLKALSEYMEKNCMCRYTKLMALKEFMENPINSAVSVATQSNLTEMVIPLRNCMIT